MTISSKKQVDNNQKDIAPTPQRSRCYVRLYEQFKILKITYTIK